MEKVAPLIYVDKWTGLFSFITEHVSHQAPEPEPEPEILSLQWVEK